MEGLILLLIISVIGGFIGCIFIGIGLGMTFGFHPLLCIGTGFVIWFFIMIKVRDMWLD